MDENPTGKRKAMDYKRLLEEQKKSGISPVRLLIAETVDGYLGKSHPDYERICEVCYQDYLAVDGLYLEEAVEMVLYAYRNGWDFRRMLDASSLIEEYHQNVDR